MNYSMLLYLIKKIRLDINCHFWLTMLFVSCYFIHKVCLAMIVWCMINLIMWCVVNCVSFSNLCY